MQTHPQLKFDALLKKGFYEELKPLGFKKKNNNFYRQLPQLGQIINVQKSRYGNPLDISFTINIGIFDPRFWLQYHDFQKIGLVPQFPTEPECLIRKRIGELANKPGWYEVNEYTDENELIQVMRENIRLHILPFYQRLDTIEKIYNAFQTKERFFLDPLAKMIFYAEYGYRKQAEESYQEIYEKSMEGHPVFSSRLESYGRKYDFIA